MSSSSDSSDDDEEAQRISQAVIPSDLLASISSSKSATESKGVLLAETPEPSGKVKGEENTIIVKSKRSDKNIEEDDRPPGYFLKTTPQFRAHVEKHLTLILDRELDANLQDSVWKKLHKDGNGKQKGIKLFSNDKVLCLGETTPPDHCNTNISKPKIQPRKHKLSSGSESSEEDKIMSCVFTVDDIEHENRMLENLSRSGVSLPCEDLKMTPQESTDSNDPLFSYCKKKKKTGIEDKGKVTTSSLISSGSSIALHTNDELSHKNKKKKKRKSNDNDGTSLVAKSDFSAGPISIEKKKKKNRIQDGVEIERCHTVHENNHNTEIATKSCKKKKKKKKSDKDDDGS